MSEQYSMSFSRWRMWQECPAAAHAKYVTGAYQPATTEAMAVGALVDAHVTQPERVAEVQAEYANLLTTGKGAPNAAAKRADAMAARLLQMPASAALIGACAKQVELYPLIGGVTWKCTPDLVDPGCRIVCDIKATGSAREVWVPHLRQYASIIAARRYGYQLAAYREACRQEYGGGSELWTAAILLCEWHTLADGTPRPRVQLYRWRASAAAQLDAYLAEMATSLSHTHTTFDGAVVPAIMEMQQQATADGLHRCGECDWCDMTADEADIEVPYADPEPRWQRTA